MSVDIELMSPLKACHETFAHLYLELRTKEGRVYTDEQLKKLPNIENTHQHYEEWKIRKHSSARLIQYLSEKKKPLNILEVGCGNGWLAAELSKIKQAHVLATDINPVEILQAKRVLEKQNLQFRLEEFNATGFGAHKFDVVVFAASIQYIFPLQDTLRQILTCMKPEGEIHIIDSKFYEESESAEAAERTHDYYEKQGYSELAQFYHHHVLSSLKDFRYEVFFNPKSIMNRLFSMNPFYWIVIRL